MRNFIFLFMLAVLSAFAVPSDVSAQYSGYLNDTIKTTGAGADTVILYPGGNTAKGALTLTAAKKFSVPGDMSIFIRTDSLSGATNGTLKLQVANRYNPTVWKDVYLYDQYGNSGGTMNGGAAQYYFPDGSPIGAMSFPFLTWRIVAIGASAAQNTRIQVDWLFKPDK